MGKQIRAVIDVGTNSVKVLVGEVLHNEVNPLWETSRQTRLGQGFYEAQLLQPGPIAATAQVIAEFAAEARQRGAVSVRVIATSAAREARNAEALLSAIQEVSGLACRVIPGALEAEWAFRGVTSNPRFAQKHLLILDVGGGSTEFILGSEGHAAFSESFPMGSVRLFERFRPSEHPDASELQQVRAWLRADIQQAISPRLSPAMTANGSPEMAIGVGGTTSLLALIHHQRRDFDRELIEETQFSKAALTGLLERLWAMPLARRREVPGLPPERADVILTGAAIYEAILDVFHIPVLGVSTRGLRFAALLDDDSHA